MSTEACRLIQMQAVEYFLDLLEGDETADLRTHVKACPACANAVRGIRGDFEVLARWGDVTPGRKAIVKLLRAYGGGGADLTVVLPGEAEEEAIAADVIADAEAAAPAAPGLLLGPTMTGEARARILREFGLDASGLRSPTRRRKQQKASVDLADLTHRAESAAARVSGRLSRSAAEDEWSALTGTTRIAGDTRGPDQPVNPELAAKASSAWEKIKARRTKPDAEAHADAVARERQSAKWEALAGQTVLAGSESDDLREELLIDEHEQEAAALMGTTILSAQTTQSALVPRYQSRVLQKIKTEGEGKRKLRRAAAIGITRTAAWSGVLAGHAAVILLTALIVWTAAQLPPPPQITLGEPKPEEEEVPPEKVPDFIDDLEKTDPTEKAEEQQDTVEQDPRNIERIATPTNAEKAAESPSEPFRQIREGRGGHGTRGDGPNAQVEWALAWLAAHQSPDGAWEWRNYRAMCEQHGGPTCGGDEITVDERETRHFTPGLTALGLLAFTASGYHHVPPRDEAAPDYKARHATRRPTVARALTWLLAQQEADGAIGRKFKGSDDPDYENGGLAQDPEGYMYNHAIGTLALCDAYATSRDDALREPAQRAVAFLCRAQDQKRGGWDYYPAGHLPKEAQKVPARHQHRGDLSITGWAVAALKVAEMAALKVPPEAKRTALEFVQRLDGTPTANPEPRYAEGYWTGWYLDPIEQALREEKIPLAQRRALLDAKARLKNNDVPEGRRGVAMTAVSAFAKLALGVPVSDREFQAQVAHMLGPANVPSEYGLKTARKGFTNHDHSYYYWYYGTLVLWYVDDERWHRWWDALKPVILKLQVTDGPAKGSWPACDPVWGPYAGRIYSTALSTLTLEVFYRYAALAKQERGKLLAGSSFAELAAEVEQAVAWCRNPATPPREGWEERAREACVRLVDAATEKSLDRDERERREARTLEVIERAARLRVPDAASVTGEAAAWRALAATGGATLRETAIRRLAKLPSTGSVELCRKLLRLFAQDEPALAVAAVSTMGAKPLVWVVRDVDAAELVWLSDPGVDKTLQAAAGEAYRRIEDARRQRAELLAKRRAKEASGAAAAAAPPGD